MRQVWAPKIPVNIWILAVAIFAVCLSLTEIIDYVELPLESLFASSHAISLFAGFVPLVSSMGYLGLFLLMFLENMALPIPSEIVLTFTGYLILNGRMDFPIALAVSTMASLLGSLVLYLVSFKMRGPLVHALAGKLRISETRLAKSEAWLAGRYGSVLILLARFTPGIRSSISIPAGVLKMNPFRFSVMTLIGSFGWSMLLIYIGYSAGSFASQMTNFLFQAAPYMIAISSVSYILYYVKFRNRSKTRAQS